jgi:hypothetical protein
MVRGLAVKKTSKSGARRPRKMTIVPSQLNSQKGVIWSLELKHFQEQFSELLLDMTKSGHNKT